MSKWSIAASVIALAFAQVSAANLIDFETVPSGGVPVDNTALSRTSAYDGGGVNVTFGFDMNNDGTTDTNAVFERSGHGDPVNAWTSPTLSADTEAPGFEGQLGDWFLRSPSLTPADWGVFVIEYDSAVTALSGEIWDIDGFPSQGTEQWRVDVFDGASTLLGSQLSPLGEHPNDAGDGAPWLFAFSNLSGAIRVELHFVGTKQTGVGLGFDNYNATSIPAPGSLALLGCAVLASRRSRRTA